MCQLTLPSSLAFARLLERRTDMHKEFIWESSNREQGDRFDMTVSLYGIAVSRVGDCII